MCTHAAAANSTAGVCKKPKLAAIVASFFVGRRQNFSTNEYLISLLSKSR
jgi:hypothetical protein